MYVLQHADKPEIYHGLPNDPHISPLVSLWKGAFKPLALGAMGLTALAFFLHYLKVGPKEPHEDPESQPSKGK
jgi:formate dehydrogenase iron-sulfur subunit